MSQEVSSTEPFRDAAPSLGVALTDEQTRVFEYIQSGKNTVITGPGGTGKTTLIKFICQNLEGRVGVTATTGTSAVLINGRTLHSYLGIGLGKESEAALFSKVRRSKALQNWNEMNALVIDEASMMSAELFDKLNYVGQNVRRNNRPFGGIQILLCGDFLQLPVINGEFCFKAKSWSECEFKVFNLTHILRQSDVEFQNCLNSARLGALSNTQLEYITGYSEEPVPAEQEGEDEHKIKPTKILCCNVDVEYINKQELIRLNSEIFEYEADTQYNPKVYQPAAHKHLFEDISKICNARPKLELALGAQVLHLVNIPDSVIVNGSRGVVVGFEDDLPVVQFKNGIKLTIGYHGYEVTETINRKSVVIGTVYQIPLRLAYAITVHKSQGMTLDSAIIDLQKVFEYGQAYVALSRVKDVKNLQLFNATVKSFRAHPHALEFYRTTNEN